MRCFFRWVVLSMVASSSAVAFAQLPNAVTPNYGRTRIAYNTELPAPSDAAVGSGVQAVGNPVTIPQQGSVDMGYSDATTSAGAYSYGDIEGVPCETECFSEPQHCGWFAGAYYMYLSRYEDNGMPLATATADPFTPVLHTSNAKMEDASGLGIRLGKMLSPCCAVEFIYWQVFPDDVTATAKNSVAGSTINSSLLFNDLTYDNGGGAAPVLDYYTDSQYQSVTRTYDYSNFELNLLRLPYVFSGGCGKASIALLGGIRYFQADESLTYFSDDLNEMPGDDPANELKYFNEVENHLVGFQLGGVLNYQFTCNLSAQLGSKVGVFNNRINQTQALSGGTGGALIAAGPDAGQPFALESKKDDIAFLSEFDIGLAYCIKPCWRIAGGYKVLAISGYADSQNQLPYDYSSLATNGLIQNNNSLILHGAYIGLEHTW